MAEHTDGLLRRWGDAARVTPRLLARDVPRGLLAVAPSAVLTFAREGRAQLHWKALGDALVAFLRSAGPVATKLGQILATRQDLLPAAICGRLEALYAHQPAMKAAALRRTLRRAWGRRLPFAEFEKRPLAVGSIGQVHCARLPDGRRVIVKILRPGVAPAIRRDLNALRAVTDLVLRLPGGVRAELRHLVDRSLADLERGLELETDFTHEAAALETFRERFARNRRVYIPECHQELSSSEVLVVEHLEGTPLSELREREPEAAPRAAGLALREVISQIFDAGCYHADPHAGNLLLMPDGRLGLIDLGLTGELGPEDRRRIARAAKAVLARDADAAFRVLLEFGSVAPDFDIEAFKRDVAAVVGRRKRGGDAGGLDRLVHELLAVSARHDVYLPPSTTLLIKTLVTIEGVARTLDPDVDVVRAALPVVLKSLAPRLLRWRPW